ncbi:TonB-dependent receptor plug domain-containing protein [Sphingobacterium sp.]|uniref:TonB-dependent receptor plug domain-containing protein n=1 Tax=Sphingobacterium sp. TaxID=341027 RepID=UPI00289DBB38|nr:TonB-dependent receptor plug domain-containing protein [Sphingobacterium sp.]
MSHHQRQLFLAALGLLATANTAQAQRRPAVDTLRNITLPTAEAIGTVSGHGRKTRLDRSQLERVQAQTLGEKLSHISGVQNASFGPNSGMPMIRSLSGSRVSVLSNGLSINDLSGISPNLNPNFDMDNLREIAVYKGATSVLYGGKAIGGAVNVKDNTIPAMRVQGGISAQAKAELGTNSGNSQSLAFDTNVGKYGVVHIGGMRLTHGNLKIPGNTKAPIAYDPKIDHLTADMAQVHVDRETIRNLTLYPYLSQFVIDNLNDPRWGLSEADLYTFEDYSFINGEKVLNPQNNKYIAGQDPNTPLYTEVVHGITDYAPVQRGVMPNSHAAKQAVNAGASYIRDNFQVGLGLYAFESYYGIPGFAQRNKPVHSHTPTTWTPIYEPINTRSYSYAWQLESAYQPKTRLIPEVKLQYRGESSDDRELLGRYRVNKFASARHSVRSEITQQYSRFWSAVSGVDFSIAAIEGQGERRYIPNNLSREGGIFTLQTIDFKPMAVHVGYRHDWVARRTLSDPTYQRSRGLAGGNLSNRDFKLNHFSGDISYSIADMGYVQATYTHAERAPGVNELFAGNDHFAILVEENGDDRLAKESANAYELSGGIHYGGLKLSATHYRSFFTNYLYLAHTGLSRSGGFLVKEWRASDTEIRGWELMGSYTYAWSTDGHVAFNAFADLVKNRNTSDDSMRKWAEGDFMPNLPTSRYGWAVAFRYKKFAGNANFDRYLKQRYLGKNINLEPAMPSYSLLAAQLGYQVRIKRYEMRYFISGNNLLNVEARPQNSILKYLAPLPGRNISIGVKLNTPYPASSAGAAPY